MEESRKIPTAPTTLALM